MIGVCAVHGAQIIGQVNLESCRSRLQLSMAIRAPEGGKHKLLQKLVQDIRTRDRMRKNKDGDDEFHCLSLSGEQKRLPLVEQSTQSKGGLQNGRGLLTWSVRRVGGQFVAAISLSIVEVVVVFVVQSTRLFAADVNRLKAGDIHTNDASKETETNTGKYPTWCPVSRH